MRATPPLHLGAVNHRFTLESPSGKHRSRALSDDPQQPSHEAPPPGGTANGTADPAETPFMSRTVGEHLRNARAFLRETLNLHEDANIQGTIETIRKDMVFRGHVVWVLVCSIFIASIGLDTNSAAVIIGAMLISPLMGPILAVGLSIGTNDGEMLRRAMKHFGVMVVVSLITSTVYFLITPFGNAQSELLARTAPTVLDGLIGLFGGLAGIIGVSRRDRGNIVPGVAIATALMPPLCAAGYGLANLNWQFFLGASYLFVLNSLFIATATVMVVRYLHFPMVEYMNVETRRKNRVRIAAFVVVALIPSLWILQTAVKRSVFEQRVVTFAQDLREDFPGIVNIEPQYHADSSSIDVYLLGEVDMSSLQADLRRRMTAAGLSNTVLDVHGERDVSAELGELGQEIRVGVIADLYERNEQLLQERNARIAELEGQLTSFANDAVNMTQIGTEVSIQYPGLQSFAYGDIIDVRGDTVDTIPTVVLSWTDRQARATEEVQLGAWLRVRLGLDTIRIVSNE